MKGGPERQIVRPHGIAKDSHGRLFVVDTFYRSVHVFDVNASRYYRFPANPIDGFLQPVGVAASGDGDVFVSDSEAGVIHFFREHGKKYVGLIGEDELERPTALVINVETGDLLAVDTLAGQVVVFDLATLEKKKVVGGKGSGEGRFNYPTGIALAADGTLHVVDSLNFRVQLLSSDYEFLREFGRAGDTPGHFSRPKGVAVDSERNTYVVDALFDNVQIFDPEGRLLLAFGSPGQGEGEFWLPNEIFVDGEDRVYVSDTYNQRLQVFQFLKAGSPR